MRRDTSIAFWHFDGISIGISCIIAHHTVIVAEATLIFHIQLSVPAENYVV